MKLGPESDTQNTLVAVNIDTELSPTEARVTATQWCMLQPLG